MRRIVVGVGGIVLAALLVGGLITGIGSAQSVESGTNASASLGADVSSFMQASGAETEGELDDEMFDAALNRTTDPEERRTLLEKRKERLEERHQTLRNQRRTLDGEQSVRTHAVATRVAIGANGLERSVNHTKRAAQEADVETDRLDAIRSNASELRGPEIARFARDLGGQPATPGRGQFDGLLEENRTAQNQSMNETGTTTESAANQPIENGSEPIESGVRTIGRSEMPHDRANESRDGPPRKSDRDGVTETSESAGGNGPRGPPGGDGAEIQVGNDNESSAEPRGFNGPDRDRGVSIGMIP